MTADSRQLSDRCSGCGSGGGRDRQHPDGVFCDRCWHGEEGLEVIRLRSLLTQCGAAAAGGPCGRRTGHEGHHATIAAHHLDEKDDLREQLRRAVEALATLERALTDALSDSHLRRQRARDVLAMFKASPPSGCPACSPDPKTARPPHTCSGEQS